MSDCIKVLIVDDHPMVREGLKASLDGEDGIQVVGDVEDGLQALEAGKTLNPDVVVMDIAMPNMNGLEAAAEFKQQLPDIKVLVLTMHEDKEYIIQMVKQGVAGYVLKDVAGEELLLAVQTVHKGGTYFSSGASDILFNESGKTESALSKREQSVLALLALGKGNKQIAQALNLSVRTIEGHRQRIKNKLGIRTSAGLVRYALENNLKYEKNNNGNL